MDVKNSDWLQYRGLAIYKGLFQKMSPGTWIRVCKHSNNATMDLLGLNAVDNRIDNRWEEKVGIGHHGLQQRGHMMSQAVHYGQANHRHIGNICPDDVKNDAIPKEDDDVQQAEGDGDPEVLCLQPWDTNQNECRSSDMLLNTLQQQHWKSKRLFKECSPGQEMKAAEGKKKPPAWI
ncbi:hypothetical protein AAY473_002808, partial [Plecturocebus cupreus]